MSYASNSKSETDFRLIAALNFQKTDQGELTW
jgi:hypothetical protein